MFGFFCFICHLELKKKVATCRQGIKRSKPTQYSNSYFELSIFEETATKIPIILSGGDGHIEVYKVR